MKLAIYHNLPSGGGKRALFEITRRLAERHEVDVYTLSTAEHDFCDLRPYCERHEIVPFSPLPPRKRPFGLLNHGLHTIDLLRLDAVCRRLAAQIDSKQYEVVFVHPCQLSNAPSLLHYVTTPTVYYCQEPPRHLYEPKVPRSYANSSRQMSLNRLSPLPTAYRATLRRLDLRNAHDADVLLANSQYSRESLYRTYGRFAKTCYLGVDTAQFRPLSLNRMGFVLSVGALAPLKGHDFVIRSLALVPHNRRPSLLIVGNSDPNAPEVSYLTALAKQRDVDVKFRLRVDDETLVHLYNQAQAVVYAPIMEPFGLIALEAMACGTPVIGVNEGGVRETILHEETGLLVERDEVAFANAVAGLLAHPQRLSTMRDNCRQYALDRWRWDAAVERVESCLMMSTEATRTLNSDIGTSRQLDGGSARI